MDKKYEYKNYKEYINIQTKMAKRTRGRTRSSSRRNRRQWIFDRMIELNIRGKSILCLGARDDSEVEFFGNNGFKSIGIDLIESKKIKKCDMSKIYKHSYFKNKKYDIVFASEILEHCLDFDGFIKGLNLICNKYFICMGPTYSKLKKVGAPDQWDCNIQNFMCYEKEKDKDMYKNSLLKTFKKFNIIINEIHKKGDRLFFILKKKKT